MKRFMMSDIHGFYEAFETALGKVDFSGENQLFLLGDYIDYGSDSRKVLEKIKMLQEKYGPQKVIALMGNHEKALLDWIDEYVDVNWHIGSVEKQYRDVEWLLSDADGDYGTLQSFLSDGHFREFMQKQAWISQDSRNTEAVRLLLEDVGELFAWMQQFPYYYETERQILVHAGIAEWGGEDWLCVTSEELMVGKTTVSRGWFYKDVIAGHISTAKITGDRTYDGIWSDGRSHYYLDGTTWQSGEIPVLEYDTETKSYREL